MRVDEPTPHEVGARHEAQRASEAIETVRPTADARGVALTAIVSHVGPVSGDAQRLQQVIWNLLSNALKFTPDGGRVEVSIEYAGAQIEVRVADTGCGIAADFLPYVFDRYRQAHRTTARQQGGLGLGLAIVRQLVELHGGTVEAASEGEGRGATFIVRLPVLPDTPAERWSALERRLTTSVDSP